MRLRGAILLIAALLAGISCNRDPNVAKQKYLENGNKYFERGKFKEASIMYRNALKKDQRYAEAYYRLGLTEMKLGNSTGAYGAFVRTVELDPKNLDARIKLADLYVIGYQTESKPATLSYIDGELDKQVAELDKLAPSAFDTLRIHGASLMVKSREAARNGQADDSKRFQGQAFSYFEKANQIKPNQPQLVLTMAGYLARVGRGPEAEKLLGQLLPSNKSFHPAYDLLVMLMYNRNARDEAEAILKQAVADNPKDLAFRRQLATHYYLVNKRDMMQVVIAQAVQAAEDKAAARRMTGDFYFGVKEYDLAKAEYQAGIQADPKAKADFQKRTAEVLILQGKSADATVILNEVLKDHKDDVQAQSMHAALLLDSAKPEQVSAAISELEAAAAKDPDNVFRRIGLGLAYMRRNQPGDLDRAQVQFQEVLKKKPNNIQARQSLADLYIAKGEYGAAETEAKTILKDYNPRNVSALISLAVAQIPQQNYAEARKNLVAAVNIDPNSTVAAYRLAELDLMEGHFKDAEDRYLKLYSARGELLGLQGMMRALLAQKQGAKAIQVLKDEVQKRPNVVGIRQLLAQVAADGGDYDLSIAQYRELLAKDPNAGILYLQLGAIYRRKAAVEAGKSGQKAAESPLNQAIDNFTKAKSLMPTDPSPLYQLALIYDGMGRTAEAKANYQAMLKLRPDDPIALNNLAYIEADRGGDLDQALSMAKRAKQQLPQNDQISDTLGWIYIKKSLPDNAVAIYEDLVTKDPKNPTFHYRLALALKAKGDKPAARKAAQSALQNKPSKDEEGKIRELLAEIG